MVSTQSSTYKKHFDKCAIKLRKINSETFDRKSYFSLFCLQILSNTAHYTTQVKIKLKRKINFSKFLKYLMFLLDEMLDFLLVYLCKRNLVVRFNRFH